MNQGRIRSAWETTYELLFLRHLAPGIKAPSWWTLYLYHRGILAQQVLEAK